MKSDLVNKFFGNSLVDFSPAEALFKRVRFPAWDFREIPASSSVYGIHPYPAMMHFLIARESINILSRRDSLIVDPFVGSGVVGVEAAISGRLFIGVDLNPLAILIAKVRSTPLNGISASDGEKIVNITLSISDEELDIPTVKNINFWFKEEVIIGLSKLRLALERLENPELKRFAKVVFAYTVRRSSNTMNGEFKLLRRKDWREYSPPDPIALFKDIFVIYLERLHSFYRNREILYEPQYVVSDMLNLNIGDETVDLVLTSPPYGDSRTTVAYGQFSRFALEWLGYKTNVDRESLGSSLVKDENVPSSVLKETLDRIAVLNEKRAREVFSFNCALWSAVSKVSKWIKPGGYAAFLVGNRRVAGIQIPTDAIIAEMFGKLGFEHKATLVRAIGNKRMPSRNSPSNVQGLTDRTMSQEFMVILRKSL